MRPASPTPDDPAIVEAACLLRAGGLVAFPTETVYGLGADATSPEAIARLYAAKGRPADNPVIVHVPGLAEASSVAVIDHPLVAPLTARFWPGPLTLVLPATPTGRVVSLGRPTVAVRSPDHPLAQALLVASGLPIAAPSANRSGRPSPTTADHVWADLSGRIDAIVDGGPCRIGLESTVLDLTADPPVVLRPGLISAAALSAFVVLGRGGDPGRSPGTRHPHYRPAVPLVVVGSSVSPAAFQAVAARSARPLAVVGAWAIDGATNVERTTSEALARHLYGDLRALEDHHATLLVRCCAPDEALDERLSRAASCVLADDHDVDRWLVAP